MSGLLGGTACPCHDRAPDFAASRFARVPNPGGAGVCSRRRGTRSRREFGPTRGHGAGTVRTSGDSPEHCVLHRFADLTLAKGPRNGFIVLTFVARLDEIAWLTNILFAVPHTWRNGLSLPRLGVLLWPLRERERTVFPGQLNGFPVTSFHTEIVSVRATDCPPVYRLGRAALRNEVNEFGCQRPEQEKTL
jgi:hypothetical protein